MDTFYGAQGMIRNSGPWNPWARIHVYIPRATPSSPLIWYMTQDKSGQLHGPAYLTQELAETLAPRGNQLVTQFTRSQGTIEACTSLSHPRAR